MLPRRSHHYSSLAPPSPRSCNAPSPPRSHHLRRGHRPEDAARQKMPPARRCHAHAQSTADACAPHLCGQPGFPAAMAAKPQRSRPCQPAGRPFTPLSSLDPRVVSTPTLMSSTPAPPSPTHLRPTLCIGPW
eukprot:354001-Chlamydomonas_euryale.AAC.12